MWFAKSELSSNVFIWGYSNHQMPGEDTRKQEVESESPSPLPKLPLQADALKSSVPESTMTNKRTREGMVSHDTFISAQNNQCQDSR